MPGSSGPKFPPPPRLEYRVRRDRNRSNSRSHRSSEAMRNCPNSGQSVLQGGKVVSYTVEYSCSLYFISRLDSRVRTSAALYSGSRKRSFFIVFGRRAFARRLLSVGRMSATRRYSRPAGSSFARRLASFQAVFAPLPYAGIRFLHPAGVCERIVFPDTGQALLVCANVCANIKIHCKFHNQIKYIFGFRIKLNFLQNYFL